MAEVVNEMPMERRRKYDWVTWFDGRVWKLTRGVDFHVAPENFRSMTYIEAKARGLAVVTRVRKDDVYLQAREKEAA